MTNNLNLVIKSGVRDVFNLSESDFFILGEFAKRGQTYRNRIKLANLSDRQVSRRASDLFENNFLILIKSTPYKNIPGKKTRIHGLTFKGFLASLRYVNLEDTYIFQEYLKLLGTKIPTDLIPYYVKYIKNFLIYFLTINKIMGIKFDDMPNVANWFDNEFDIDVILNQDVKLLKTQKKLTEEYYEDIELNIPDDIYGQEHLANWYFLRNYWHRVIEKIAEQKKFSKIISEIKKENPGEFENEIRRRYLERLKYDLAISRNTNLYTDNFLNRRKNRPNIKPITREKIMNNRIQEMKKLIKL
jgi:hypothetical protein